MFTRNALILVSILVLGCGPKVATEIAPNSNDGTPNSSSTADAPTGSRDTNLQTVDGKGFTFQSPLDWKILPAGSNGAIGISSPFDIVNEIPPVPVSIGIVPVPQGALTPVDAVTSMLELHRSGGQVESEEKMTVSGREATKLVTTTSIRRNDTSDDVYVSRNVRVFVPVDAGVLIVQVSGADKQVKSLMPQIDAIAASIKLK